MRSNQTGCMRGVDGLTAAIPIPAAGEGRGMVNEWVAKIEDERRTQERRAAWAMTIEGLERASLVATDEQIRAHWGLDPDFSVEYNPRQAAWSLHGKLAQVAGELAAAKRELMAFRIAEARRLSGP